MSARHARTSALTPGASAHALADARSLAPAWCARAVTGNACARRRACLRSPPRRSTTTSGARGVRRRAERGEDVRRGTPRRRRHRRRALRRLLRRRVRARAQTKHARGPDRRDRVFRSGGASETEYTFVGGFFRVGPERRRAVRRRPRGRVPRARGHLVRAGSSPGRGDRFARRHRGSGRGRRSLSRSERDAGGGVGGAVPRRERTPRRRRGGRKRKRKSRRRVQRRRVRDAPPRERRRLPREPSPRDRVVIRRRGAVARGRVVTVRGGRRRLGRRLGFASKPLQRVVENVPRERVAPRADGDDSSSVRAERDVRHLVRVRDEPALRGGEPLARRAPERPAGHERVRRVEEARDGRRRHRATARREQDAAVARVRRQRRDATGNLRDRARHRLARAEEKRVRLATRRGDAERVRNGTLSFGGVFGIVVRRRKRVVSLHGVPRQRGGRPAVGIRLGRDEQRFRIRRERQGGAPPVGDPDRRPREFQGGRVEDEDAVPARAGDGDPGTPVGARRERRAGIFRPRVRSRGRERERLGRNHALVPE